MTDLFDCFICLGRLRDAVLCPACSKLACRSCMKHWIESEKQSCPHCRQPLTTQQLVEARFLDDIRQYLIMDNNRNQLKQQQQLPSLCHFHLKKMQFYCQQCNRLLCNRCKELETDNHTHEHQLISLEEFEKSLRVSLSFEREKLFVINEELFQSTKELEQSFQQLEHEKKTILDHLRVEFMKCSEQIQQRHSKRKDFLTMQQKNISEASKNVLMLSERLNDQLKHINSHDYLNSLQSDLKLIPLIEKQIAQSRSIHSLPSIDIDLIPTYKTLAFDIEKISSSDQLISSPILSYCGSNWRLKLSITKTTDNLEFLSAFLELTSSLQYSTMANTANSSSPGNGTSSSTSQKYQFFVSIKSHIKRETIARYYPGESWGFSRLIPINELKYDDDGKLTVSFGVRHLTHRELSNSQKKYIAKLENDREKASLQLSSFKKRLQDSIHTETHIPLPMPRQLSVNLSDDKSAMISMDELGKDQLETSLMISSDNIGERNEEKEKDEDSLRLSDLESGSSSNNSPAKQILMDPRSAFDVANISLNSDCCLISIPSDLSSSSSN